MTTPADIMQLIEEEDVEFIRLQFTDVLGILKNIAVTPSQMNLVLERKYSIAGYSLFDGFYNFDENLYLVPDLDSFVILPWRPQQGKVGKLICDICYEDGSTCDMSPRTILKKVREDAQKEGIDFVINPECEFFLFHTDDNGNPTTITHEKAGYLGVGPIDFGENARRDMVLNLEEMGFRVESSHHEKAPGQHEIDFTAGEMLETADAIMNFKFAVRSIAKRFGLYATFMPKPTTDAAGSGMHLNIAAYKDGKNLFEMVDGEMSDTAKYFIGGIMAHAEGMCAITNPTVNSYKRLLSAGYDAPNKINWSTKGENSAIKYYRSLGETKVELRFPDSSSNPYLAIAVCIAAGLDGIRNQIVPKEENESGSKKLPGNLKDAVRAMRKDSLVQEVLGEELYKHYETIKKNEWDRYMMEVSDWEIEHYLIKM